MKRFLILGIFLNFICLLLLSAEAPLKPAVKFYEAPTDLNEFVDQKVSPYHSLLGLKYGGTVEADTKKVLMTYPTNLPKGDLYLGGKSIKEALICNLNLEDAKPVDRNLFPYYLIKKYRFNLYNWKEKTAVKNPDDFYNNYYLEILLEPLGKEKLKEEELEKTAFIDSISCTLYLEANYSVYYKGIQRWDSISPSLSNMSCLFGMGAVAPVDSIWFKDTATCNINEKAVYTKPPIKIDIVDHGKELENIQPCVPAGCVP